MAESLPGSGGGLLDGYEPAWGFDEAFESDGSARDVYRRIVERFGELDADEAQRLERLVADEFRRQGITFTVYSEGGGHRADLAHRPLPPAHISARMG